MHYNLKFSNQKSSYRITNKNKKKKKKKNKKIKNKNIPFFSIYNMKYCTNKKKKKNKKKP